MQLPPRFASFVTFLAIAAAFTACKGDDGAPGRDGMDAPIPPSRADALPGFNLEILRVEGGTGPNGNLRPGDTPRVTFTAREGEPGTTDGDPIPPENWGFQELLFAGPATNYQLIFDFGDLDTATQNGDGSWTFTFPEAIPATVPLQINQEGTIPYDSGTLAGEALPSGTYTIGIALNQAVEIEDTEFTDGTSVTFDVLVGDATAIDHPELVTDANCNNCHTVMRAHGNNRYGVKYCVLCHTNGSEDLNDPGAVAGETLGLTIAFQNMIHKIHSGRHLPSVNGKTVDMNGNPVYGAGTPYVIVRSRGEFDFSHVAFPQWPHLAQGMPRDIGYSDITDDMSPNYDPLAGPAENAILGGPTNCDVCHGDPDGDGPEMPPAHGDSIFTNAIVTRACIACHDDWDPSLPYAANGLVMPANLGDDTCTACHGENPTNPNSAIDVRKAHTHPLLDTNDPPLWGPGAGARNLTFNITEITDASGNMDGLVEVGEKVQVTLEVVDGDGTAIPGTDLDRMEVVITGPLENPNMLYVDTFSGSMPASSVIGAGPTSTFTLPERVFFEVATVGGMPTVYTTAKTPHYPTEFGASNNTTVYTVSTGDAIVTELAAAAPAHQNYLDVQAGDGMSFSPGDFIVVDEGNANVEYLEVVRVQDDRLWFSAPIDLPGIRPEMAHDVGAEIRMPTLTLLATPADYTLDAMTGTVTLAMAPTDPVLVSYTTDFVVPARYRGTINNSPSLDPTQLDLDDRIGEWTGFDLVAGTYSIGVYGEIGFDVDVVAGMLTETTSYLEGSTGQTVRTFRLGSSGDLDTYDRIASEATCYACHRDLQFHGSHRRGFQNCLLCHGISGGEDWPQFKTNNLASIETPGVAIEFREMIHKIHHGRNLAAGEDYVVAGFRGSPHSYELVGFPSFKGETANCDACHGEGNEAWFAPTTRVHPDQSSTAPQVVWRFVCASCHDDRTALAHIGANTSNDLESCEICHGEGKELSVELVHKNLVR